MAVSSNWIEEMEKTWGRYLTPGDKGYATRKNFTQVPVILATGEQNESS